jgi:LPXTG-site transpeptidase (sortase) family protein
VPIEVHRPRRPGGLALIVIGEVVLALALGSAAFTWLKPSAPPPGEGREIPGVIVTGTARAATFSDTTAALAATAPARGVYIRIPRCGIDEAIHQGVSVATLDLGVGHFTASAVPGARGNCALAAHGASGVRHGAPFERLKELTNGDEVFLHDSAGRNARYVVTSHRVVDEHDMSVLRATSDSRLTLITCVVPSRITHKRLVVTAVRAD